MILLHSGSLLRLAVAVSVTILDRVPVGSEVLETSLGISLHSLAAILPAGGTDLAMLVGELEGLNEADGLLDVATDRQVVDGDLS